MKRTLVLNGLFVAGVVATVSAQGTPTSATSPNVYAITNVTIVPVVGARVSNGTVVIRDGKIAAAGAGM
ncbi:MAG TPA: hypothetical protein VGP61_05150, partial [Gemmatimonadales bacterium]|nr:hypothetical protein [Gemmatimonadales bacterium]